MIDIEHVSFTYEAGTQPALRDVSLHIEDGDFVGIIGESGAGKTTLGHVINGIVPHHYHGDFYGVVHVDGLDTFEEALTDLSMKIGTVSQDIDNQMVAAEVEDEILYGLENFGVPAGEIDGRINDALSAVGCEELRPRRISTLSGGQKQKIAIASIVALAPGIMLLDEPTAELDPQSSYQIFQLLRTLNEQGMTIIVIEQKVMLLAEFAKHLVLMDKGEIVLSGTVAHALQHIDVMERYGVNCPRVATLTKRLANRGIGSGRIVAQVEEAAEYVEELLGSPAEDAAAFGRADEGFNNRFPLQGGEAAEYVEELLGSPAEDGAASGRADEGSLTTASGEDRPSPARDDGTPEGRHPEQRSPLFASASSKDPSQNASAPADAHASPVLEFQNVSFSYKDHDVLSGLSFTVNRGEFVAILGPNGTGKSTTLRLANGLLQPSAGTVRVAGLDTRTAKTSQIAHHVGFLFQNPDRQICQATTRAEIEFSLHALGFSESEVQGRAQAMLELMHLDGDADPFSLSKGQRQAVAVASIMAVDPEIMILDEPTTGFDYAECCEIMKHIKALNAKGTTVVMVCHDMEVVLDYADRCIVMAGGCVVGDAPARQIFASPAVLAAASLLPPQIYDLSRRLAPTYPALGGIFGIGEMADAIAEISAVFGRADEGSLTTASAAPSPVRDNGDSQARHRRAGSAEGRGASSKDPAQNVSRSDAPASAREGGAR